MNPFVRALLSGLGYRVGSELGRHLVRRWERGRARARRTSGTADDDADEAETENAQDTPEGG